MKKQLQNLFKIHFKSIYSIFFVFGLVFLTSQSIGQIVVSTTSSFTNNNGTGTVTFNLQNTNNFAISINSIEGVTNVNGSVTTKLFYKTTPISGAPGAMDSANGWNMVAVDTITGIANTTTTVTQTFLTGLNFIIPANTTYGIAVFATGQRYFSHPGPITTDSASGVKIITGTNIGYAGGTPPTAPGTNSRGWIGKITFMPTIACSGKPTAGLAIADRKIACANQDFNLSLVNDSIRLGLSYQWQSSTVSQTSGFVNNTSDTTRSVVLNQTVTKWYRCILRCGGVSADTSTVILVKTPSATMAGTYTLNQSLALSLTNYHSLSDFAAELTCAGLSGAVVLNVAPNSATFNENIEFGNIAGSSAINTITLNGNGNTIYSTSGPIVTFSGTQFLKLDSFNISGDASFSGFGIYLNNLASNITITNNKINVGQTSTATSNAGIVASGATSTATTAGTNAKNLIITNNEIIGGYYGISLVGSGSYSNNSGHLIQNNICRDFYVYGIYLANTDTVQAISNNIHRMNRTGLSTFNGIYLSSCRNTKIVSNKVHDCGSGTFAANPITITGSSNTIGYETELINNSIYNINTSGTIYGIYMLGTRDRINVYYNTVALDVLTGTTRAIFFSTAPTNHIIKNNIFSIASGGTGTKYCIYVTPTVTNMVSNNNVFYIGATTGTNHIGFWSSARTTLAAWTAANGQDSSSIVSNPMFVNSSMGNLTPLTAKVDNIGTPIAGISQDQIGTVRSLTTPDAGALEFTGIPDDISIVKGILKYNTPCYSNADTVSISIKNTFGSTINFSINPLTINWSVNGPKNTSGSFIINSGTLNIYDTLTLSAMNVDMSMPGSYTLNAHIPSNAINLVTSNDTLTPAIFIVRSILEVSPKSTLITVYNDTLILTARSTLFPGAIFFSEISHNRSSIGQPIGGWPSYLIADDYVEITGVPNLDLDGYTVEEWSTTALTHTKTFTSGTLFSPNGTMVLATGQLGSSTPSAANFYYHTGNTVTHNSTTVAGYILKDNTGKIVDAVAYGNYAFPIAANVTAKDWSGITSAANAGIRLNAPDNNTASSWINSSVSPQDPNSVNYGVNASLPGVLSGFDWKYLGNTIANTPEVKVGPFTTPNTVYTYIATFTNSCGTFYDTAIVTTSSTVPVKLMGFKASIINDDILVKWNTTSEVDNKVFEVEKSINGVDFYLIGSINGNGNSTKLNNYSLIDIKATITSANNLFYRLKQINHDGKFEYSNIVSIQLNKLTKTDLVTFPNPSNGSFKISADIGSNNIATIKVINTLGATVWSKNVTTTIGINTFEINTILPQGVYLLLFEMGENTQMQKISIN